MHVCTKSASALLFGSPLSFCLTDCGISRHQYSYDQKCFCFAVITCDAPLQLRMCELPGLQWTLNQIPCILGFEEQET